MDDDETRTGSSSTFSIGEVYVDIKGTDRGTETNPEPLVISEGFVWTSRGAEPVGVPGELSPEVSGLPFLLPHCAKFSKKRVMKINNHP